MKSKNPNNLFRKVLGVGLVCFLLYVILSTLVFNFLLKYYGACGKAVLLNKTNRVRYHKATLYYNFYHDGEIYQVNSLEEDLTRVGDTINVVYLKFLPYVNRPTVYFKENEILRCE